MIKSAQMLSQREYCSYSSSLLLLILLLLLMKVGSLESSKPLQVVSNPQISRSIGGQQQQSNVTVDAPNYISTGRKISKILNDFFDVSSNSIR